MMMASPLSAAVAPGAELASALAHGSALQSLLEKEFKPKTDNAKTLVEALGRLVGNGDADQALERPEWLGFRDLMLSCRDLHRRNEVLIRRKLDAIRGTLHTLRGADPTASVEVYDRLGRMARMRGGRGYEEA